jgi:CRP/FNR family transcriptional regulator, nitrogen oxide reductase regulator
MPSSEIAEEVRSLNPRWLEGLPPEALQEILEAAKLRAYPANSVVTHEGHPADYLFLIVSGRGRFFSITPEGQKTVVSWLPPGHIFGGAAVLSVPVDYVLNTEATSDSRMLVWNRASLTGLTPRHPRLLENALLIAHDYLIQYRAIHLALACQTARQRLATVLVNLAVGMGQKVAEGVELDINNEELASEAHVTQFTASRLLSEWQRNGMVVKKRGKVLLPSPTELLASES